ncbi:hypothetical protein [Curtobacterium sp. MCSS17_016]|uniref:hypothetical protein n=1 Tax=Curtobacterium sp. MCSS17_016 TaxID=2175644 RepID=UPI0011B41EC2|nr:hypothetical protein [Curtobacterium sp. MCSS17_016]WIE80874.1 hypothetical protein DEJ19_020370 [Curtobacterium sp. MCSS17_016]
MPTNTLRVRAVRLHHQEAGAPLDLDALRAAVGGFEVLVPETRTLVRGGKQYVTPAEAIAQQPKVHRGKNVASVVRGRRNAFLIVLFAHLGLNRTQIREVVSSDIAPAPLSIQGVGIPRGEDPASCYACAVTRWLRIVWATERADHASIRQTCSVQTYYDDVHDCDEGLERDWRYATTLLPAVDQHGWVDSHRSISTRTLSAVVGNVLLPTGYREQEWKPAEPKPTRFDDMRKDEFDLAMEDFDRRMAQALARSAEVLADAQDTADELYGLINPKAG